MKRVIFSSTLIFFFLLLGTVLAILYGKGYRLIPDHGSTKLEGTGLLVLTSKPDAAKVYINDKLTTATNNTINLAPGEYNISIVKDGYLPWQKKITIAQEIVARADALLFPYAPKLEALTLTGAQNPVIDPTNTLISYSVSSASGTKNGIYTLDMTSRPIINFGGAVTQLSDDSILALSGATLQFSPDSTQLIAEVPGRVSSSYYLLSSKSFNQNPTDVTNTLFTLQSTWEKLKTDKAQKRLDSLPTKVQELIVQNFSQTMYSPEDDKVMYVASRSAQLPIIISPRRIGVDSTAEQRTITEGNYYVYDIKEDRNYLLLDVQKIKDKDLLPRYSWFPDSNHILYVADKKISIVEYDGLNATVVYGGPFEDHFVFPWPDGSRLVILTNLNSSSTPYNLYTISLK